MSIEYGTVGLALRLQRVLGSVSLQSDPLILASLRLGLELHQDDERTYEPYNNHLLRVALRLIEDLGIDDRLIIAAAPLHDSLEDHPDVLAERYLGVEIPDEPHIVRELGYRGLQAFATEFDALEVADIVRDVSNPIPSIDDNDKNKIIRYVEHVRHLMHEGQPRARILKIADIVDNVDVPPGLEDPEKRKRLDHKQLGIYPSVKQGLARADDQVASSAREQVLHVLEDRHGHTVQRLRMGPKSEAA